MEKLTPTALEIDRRDLTNRINDGEVWHVQFAKGLDDWPGLIQEFIDYRRKLSAVGRESFGNFRPGSHDDRLSRLGIGLWHATYGYEEMSTIKLMGL